MTLVDELARNNMAQQELDEDHPAKIFGQTIESDRIKRAREEVTIAELDGQLERRRIESIHFCYEALESTGGVDDRDKLRAADMIRTVAFRSSSSSTGPAPEKEVCVREVINASGRSRETGLDCKVGKLAKKLYLADHPEYVFPKKQIYANGQLFMASMWLESQIVISSVP